MLTRNRLLLVSTVIAGAMALVTLFFLLSPAGSASATARAAQLPGLPQPELRSDDPVFPTPTDATLLNVVRGADGSRSYVYASSQSAANVVEFYGALEDARWQAATSTAIVRQTVIAMSDREGAYPAASVTVHELDPTRIVINLLANTTQPEAGPVLGNLPVATDLPSDFPPELIPPGAEVLNGGEADDLLAGIFRTDQSVAEAEASLRTQLAAAGATDPQRLTEGGAVALVFRIGERHGQLAIESAPDGTTRVSVVIER